MGVLEKLSPKLPLVFASFAHEIRRRPTVEHGHNFLNGSHINRNDIAAGLVYDVHYARIGQQASAVFVLGLFDYFSEADGHGNACKAVLAVITQMI